VAISTNAMILGNSMPAKSSFQTHAGSNPNQVGSDQGADPNQTSQTNGADTGSSGSDTAPDASGTSASNGPKTTGPSAQTRTAQAPQSRGHSRAGRAATSGAGAASNPANADAADAADDASTDFSSIMANAFGRSAAATPGSATPTQSSNTGGSTTSAQQATPAPADAVAWIAQVMMPPGTTTPSATAASGRPGANSASAIAIGSATSGAAPPAQGAAVPGLPADPTATTANDPVSITAREQVAGRETTGAIQEQLNADPAPQLQTAQTSDAQTAASSATANGPLGTIGALADAQRLIAGLTGADSADRDADSVATTPTVHAGGATDGADTAQAAAALQASSLTRSAGLGNATLSIQTPVASAGFAEEMSSRVTGLAQAGITQAQLQLNPTDMGPVQVHITLQSGQASVWFGANHADTRAALEQSLPRLRELFAGAGMPLTDSGVFREPPQQQQAQSLPAASSARSTDNDAATVPTVTQVSNIRLSLLDTYA
jgi:flagellar hook-length control protein FliK